MVPPPVAPTPPGYGQPGPVANVPSTAFDGSAAAVPTAPPPIEAPAPPAGSPSFAAPYAAGYAVPAYAESGLLVAQPRALFRDRLAAFLLDVVIVGVPVLLFDGGPTFFPLLLIYMIAFWTWKQTTPGGAINQIRLVRSDGTALSFADALVRALAGIFSLAVFALGALWILRDPERQAWHDKIAGTYVVKVPKHWPW
jgi:uncharacterized RDD family membrane protein YckC